MNLQRANADIARILRRFAEQVRGATAAQRLRLLDRAKGALQTVRKAFVYEISEKQVTRTPVKFVRYFPKADAKIQASLSEKLDERILKAMKKVDGIAEAAQTSAPREPGEG